MTYCGTKIRYGDVVLENVLTNSILYEPVYDPTGVDPIGLKIVIDVVSTLHKSVRNLHGANVNWSLPSAAGLATGLQDTLNEFCMPRQAFWMWIGGVPFMFVRGASTAECDTWYDADEAGDGAVPEIAHGPRVTAKILSVQGVNAVKCEFHFEMTVPIRCYNGAYENILSLRWWIADDVDCSDWTTTRNYTGVLRVKSKKVNSHELARSHTLPPLTKGFRRERIGWHESADGLTLTFSITDKEVWANAPAPATDWEGSYTVSFPQMGTTTEQELNFRLKSSKDVPKENLFNLAAAIIEAKLHWESIRKQGEADANMFVLSSSWSEDLKHNAVSVNVRAKVFGGKTKDKNGALEGPARKLINIGFKGKPELGQPLPPSLGTLWKGEDPPHPEWHNDYNKEDAFLPPDGKWATLAGIFVCALQNPCCRNDLADPSYTNQGTTEVTKSDEVIYDEYAENPLKDYEDEAEYYSPSHLKAMYEYYRITNTIDVDTGWRAFPLGKQCNDSSYDDTVAFSQIHCPVAVRTVRIHASRINAWPELPKPIHWKESNGIKHVLKSFRVEPNPVQLSADGRDKLCEVYAVYEYYLSRPPQKTELITVGRVPYVSTEDLIIVTNKGTDDELWLDASVYDQDRFFIEPKDLLDQNY